jgi:hypothetical protein
MTTRPRKQDEQPTDLLFWSGDGHLMCHRARVPADTEVSIGRTNSKRVRKERKRKERRLRRECLPTAAMMVTDRFETLAVELTFLALGLPMPGEFGARAAA